MGAKIKDWPAYFKQRSIENIKTGCWIWQGGLLGPRKEYGFCGFEGKTSFLAHRASYITFKGSIPAGLHVMHTCNNTKCVNPEHLEVGTLATNNHDRWLANSYFSKLTCQKHLEIKQEYATQNTTLAALANKYSISAAYVHRIVHNLTKVSRT